MLRSNIGQNTVEKSSRVTPSANVGGNVWEGSFRVVNGRGEAGGMDIRDVWSFFFFQAEDGIRGRTVTGVQTCALPICAIEVQQAVHGKSADAPGRRGSPIAPTIAPARPSTGPATPSGRGGPPSGVPGRP